MADETVFVTLGVHSNRITEHSAAAFWLGSDGQDVSFHINIIREAVEQLWNALNEYDAQVKAERTSEPEGAA